MSSAAEQVFTGARIVLADRVIDGTLVVREGLVAEVAEGRAAGDDFEGDYLIPGLVELHTDHIESHYRPRPGVRWNPVAAVQAHDAQIAASGITTVFDALRIGLDEQSELTADDMARLAEAIRQSGAGERLRADHFLHLRCEVSAPDCEETFERFRDDEQVRMVSLMDHSPGQRQFASMDAYRTYYQGKLKMSDADLDAFSARRMRQSAIHAEPNRAMISAFCRAEGIVLASHDDATIEHVDRAREQGIRVAEFPTTLEAAHASREAGMSVLMGAPNIVRGGSHSGNVSARTLVEAGVLDILSSDYIPFSLLHAAFTVGEAVDGISLPQAVALVSKHPAEAGGLADRGEIAPGKRADLVRVTVADGVPIVRAVWRQGRRVA
jgi:alpha-D-ribose 1-methylphosphonate 5-triphosphate diphosphatase